MIADPGRLEAQKRWLCGALFSVTTRGNRWVRSQEEPARRWLLRGLERGDWSEVEPPLGAVRRLVDHVFFVAGDEGVAPGWEVLDVEDYFRRRLVMVPPPLGQSVSEQLGYAASFLQWQGAVGALDSQLACDLVRELSRVRFEVAFRLAG